MGELILLSERRASRVANRRVEHRGPPGDERRWQPTGDRRRGGSGLRAGRGDASARPAFFFDLACPFSYLEADGVERTLGDVDWIPVNSATLAERLIAAADDRGPRHIHLSGRGASSSRAIRRVAERRASELRLPIVWPERPRAALTAALRAAAFATESGAGARFALAAGRLAYCGGFDLDDPDVLAEAAAAAGLPLGQTLAAARDPARDLPLRQAAQDLAVRGVQSLPAVSVGGTWHQGTGAVLRARELVRWRAATNSTLAPAG